MGYPRIYLAIDNCFAYKRWTDPDDWAKMIAESGLRYVESSADTECDMLYSDADYLAAWREKIKKNCERYGIRVPCAYTGHGTYATLGLTHLDARCRERMLTKWMYPHIDNAADFGQIAGFFCHAFDDTVLQDPATYQTFLDILYDQMTAIAVYAGEKGVLPSLEQMYSPQQYPWRIADAEDIVRKASRPGAPLYITVDTGHQYGQQRFLKPSREEIIKAIADGTELYVGPACCYEILSDAREGKIASEEAAEKILSCLENYPFLFAEASDSDTYLWLKRLGKYAPIVHLQQTDNTASAHKDFSEKNNASGIVSGEKVLRTLYECFSEPDDPTMPPPVDTIYLTLELFYSNAEKSDNIRRSIAESVRYWRKFIPEDGLTLDVLVNRLAQA